VSEPWGKSVHCESRAACWQCRTRRDFREWIACNFGGVDGPDFECPHDFTAEDHPPRLRGEQHPRWIAARLAECGRCGDTTCKMNNVKPCERLAALRRPGVTCPAAEPKWGMEAPKTT
jgi:hypothetical protein